jgi:membrane protein YqaA with SNARE-associated domain
MNELITLFSLSFLSSTLLPGGSEAYLSFLALNSHQNYFALLAFASIGNTLGGFTNWLIGFAINSQLLTKNKYLNLLNSHSLTSSSKSKAYLIAEKWIKKWGYLSLLLSWLPLIGDLLCLITGLYKLNAYKCIAYIFTGKFIRYTILLLLIDNIAR